MYRYEEKAALHEAIKDEYFDVISEENFLVLDLNVDTLTGERQGGVECCAINEVDRVKMI